MTGWIWYLLLSPGRAERHGFEYYPHGALSPYAALDTQSGKVLGKTAARHTSQEFVEFLTEVVERAPARRSTCDLYQESGSNLSAHQRTQAWFVDFPATRIRRCISLDLVSSRMPWRYAAESSFEANLAGLPHRRYSCVMRPLRYSINVTLDGCCDHRAMSADEDLHRHAVENLDQADALLFGRVTYEMMEAAWRPPARTGARPDWMEPFARTIDAAKKYVVSSTLDRVDWNAELVRGDLGKAVQQLKRESGKGLFVGGVKLPLALAELGLIDEYEFVVQPRLAGHGPTLFAGLSKHVDLKLVSRLEFGSGAVAMRYEPRR